MRTGTVGMGIRMEEGMGTRTEAATNATTTTSIELSASCFRLSGVGAVLLLESL